MVNKPLMIVGDPRRVAERRGGRMILSYRKALSNLFHREFCGKDRPIFYDARKLVQSKAHLVVRMHLAASRGLQPPFDRACGRY